MKRTTPAISGFTLSDPAQPGVPRTAPWAEEVDAARREVQRRAEPLAWD